MKATRLQKWLVAAAAALTLMLGAALPALAATDLYGGVCSNAQAKSSTLCQGQSNTNPLVGPHGLMIKVTQIVAAVAGVVAVIIIIISGYKFLMSGGDPAKTTAARNTILYALVGIAVIAVAQSIVSFVLSKL